MTDTVRVTNTLRSALTVAPEPRERMQRFETGRNDETDTYYVASTDRTVLISQIDRAAREVALAATPAPLDDDGWQERGNPGDDATPPAPLDVERECEHRRTTPCIDRNGSCGTHRSPWAGDAPTPAPHPGENHDYRMTCLRCGEPGYLFVGFHSPGETFRWSEAKPKEADHASD